MLCLIVLHAYYESIFMVAKVIHYSNGMLFTHLYICVCGHGSTVSCAYSVNIEVDSIHDDFVG